jgi:hypothetical protein
MGGQGGYFQAGDQAGMISRNDLTAIAPGRHSETPADFFENLRNMACHLANSDY